jgi:uncharacterized protein YndB with AHSA1/START domain
MSDFEATTDINAPADEVFAYLSDIDNLSEYFERMTSAEPGEGDEVHVTADLGDRQVEADAWFTIDDGAMSLAWGSEGPNDYQGHLEVTGDAESCRVTVTLSTERDAGPEVDDGLEQTLANIKRLTESLGD